MFCNYAQILHHPTCEYLAVLEFFAALKARNNKSRVIFSSLFFVIVCVAVRTSFHMMEIALFRFDSSNAAFLRQFKMWNY